MSTRATIRLKEGENIVNLYHHHDGYPEGVGEDLKQRLNNDKGYWDMHSFANLLIKDNTDEYELTYGQHGDEIYAYLIDFDTKTITCYKVGWHVYEWKNIVFQETFDKYKRTYAGVTWDRTNLLSCKNAARILYEIITRDELETLDFGNLDLDSVIDEFEYFKKCQEEIDKDYDEQINEE